MTFRQLLEKTIESFDADNLDDVFHYFEEAWKRLATAVDEVSAKNL